MGYQGEGVIMELTQEQLAKLTPDHPILVVIERMTLIEKKMKENDPLIASHLKEIWKHMQQYEELAHLLTPEQIGSLSRALQKHTSVTLVVDTPKSKGKAKKYSVDDLV
jgi:hypothetical protein